MIGSEWKCLVHFLDQFLRKKVFVILFFFHFAIGWKILKPETASWTIDGSHMVEMLILTHSGRFTPSSSVREKPLSYWSHCIVGLSVCTFYMPICACMLSCSRPVQLFAILWTVTHQASLTMGFSRREYWSGLLCPPPGDLPDPGIRSTSLVSPAMVGGSLPLVPPEKPLVRWLIYKKRQCLSLLLIIYWEWEKYCICRWQIPKVLGSSI